MNPVVLLDEVDKLSAGGWSGDPTAALLEVLDPAQNHTFRDHYLEVELDLSRRRVHRHRQRRRHHPRRRCSTAWSSSASTATPRTRRSSSPATTCCPGSWSAAGCGPTRSCSTTRRSCAIVADYTREAGVRGLERELGKLLRKVAARVGAGETAAPIVDRRRCRADATSAGRRSTTRSPSATTVPGVATGLAVTGTGGDVLFIEASASEGEAGLTLTGQLGDVMKESAQIALSYVRSHAAELGVDAGTLQPPVPRPRAGRRRAEGRPVGRGHHDHGASCRCSPVDR